MAMRETRLALVLRATFHWLLEVSPGFNRFVIEQLNERLAQFLSIIKAGRKLPRPESRLAWTGCSTPCSTLAWARGWI